VLRKLAVACARTPLGSRALAADAVRLSALDRRHNRVTIRLDAQAQDFGAHRGGHRCEATRDS
jgi:hypothetical protein